MQFLRKRGTSGLQAGDFGQPVADLAVESRVFDRNGDVACQQLHYLAILCVENASAAAGQHAEDTDHAILPPDRHRDTRLERQVINQPLREVPRGRAQPRHHRSG